jgi:hypothetical protein
MNRPRRTIDTLVGEELNAVSFVMDYVEFHFNGPVLRALTDPVLEAPGGRWISLEPGWRDALCSVIGASVLSVEVREDDAISLALSGDRRLIVPLDDDSREGRPEAATFQGEALMSPGNWLDVW